MVGDLYGLDMTLQDAWLPNERFYVATVNEASESEPRAIVLMLSPIAKPAQVCRMRQRKTLLYDWINSSRGNVPSRPLKEFLDLP